MKRDNRYRDLPLHLHDAFNPAVPLTRLDIHNDWTETERWICLVCEFSNSSKKTACVLCGTSVAGTSDAIPIRKLGRINLNSRQRSAKQRNEWSRSLSHDGKCVWERRQEQDDQTIGFVATNRSSSDRLTFTDCNDTDANISITGYEIDQQDLSTVRSVAAMSFPEKYAWFLQHTSALMKPWKDGRLKLRVHRSEVLVESMEQLLGIQTVHIHMPLRVEFIGESGIDAGGLEREWIALLSEKLFDDRTGLFQRCCSDNVSYRINPLSVEASEDHLEYFRGAGRFLGRALLEGQLLQAQLSLPLLKHFLGVPITFADLEYVDQQVYESMIWIRDTPGVEALGLDFTLVELSYRGEPRVIELKPNGAQCAVTDENKHEYLFLRLKYIMLTSFEPQLRSLLTGLFQVIPQELLLVFDYKELELVLCGVPEIDVEDWRMHTHVSDDLIGSELLEWFWETVMEMDQDQRARLLQYSTGTARVPVQGFKGLTSYDGRICLFTLKSIPYSDSVYPRSHTCFNRIDLPLYKTRSELEENLHLVIQMEITGFTDE